MKKYAFAYEMAALILMIIGGVNWGFIGLFDWDLLGGMFGEVGSVTRTLYGVIALAALYRILIWIQSKKSA